jgi:hypothetical protein
MINIVYHEGAEGGVHGRPRYANLTMLHEAFDSLVLADKLRIPPQHWAGMKYLPEWARGAAVVIHGGNEYHADSMIGERVSEEVAELDWVVFIVTGDEASEMPARQLQHPNSRLWVQNPKPGVTQADRYLICGYPNDCRDQLDRWRNRIASNQIGEIRRDLDWSFAGQMTHRRRHEMGAAFSGVERGALVATAGFGQGLDHESYYKQLLRSKVVLCPSGPATPDSYRMAEALEAGAVPVLDACALDGVRGYWGMVFDEHPFPVVEEWVEGPEKLKEVLADYERVQRECAYFWKKYKLTMRGWLEHDLKRLGALR